jgi:cobalamin-dependent methionine synthase I
MLIISNQIDIDQQEVLNHIGYGMEYKPSARITSLVNDYIENYHDLIASSYAYKIRDIESIEDNRVHIGDSITLESKVIARLLKRCKKVAVFALTIGNYLEEMVAYLAENGLVLQATVLDAIGSGAAEKLAVYVEDRIRQMAHAEGFVASWRFSPGYCDWEVHQQKMVFQALNGDTAGIRLTESLLMIPRKSISGIIGIGPADNGIEDYNPCCTCKKKECPGRRK